MTKHQRELWLRRAAAAWLSLVVLFILAGIVVAKGWAGVVGIGAALGGLLTILAAGYLMGI